MKSLTSRDHQVVTTTKNTENTTNTRTRWTKISGRGPQQHNKSIPRTDYIVLCALNGWTSMNITRNFLFGRTKYSYWEDLTYADTRLINIIIKNNVARYLHVSHRRYNIKICLFSHGIIYRLVNNGDKFIRVIKYTDPITKILEISRAIDFNEGYQNICLMRRVNKIYYAIQFARCVSKNC